MNSFLLASFYFFIWEFLQPQPPEFKSGFDTSDCSEFITSQDGLLETYKRFFNCLGHRIIFKKWHCKSVFVEFHKNLSGNRNINNESWLNAVESANNFISLLGTTVCS